MSDWTLSSSGVRLDGFGFDVRLDGAGTVVGDLGDLTLSSNVKLNGSDLDWRLDGTTANDTPTGELPIAHPPPDAGLVGNGWRFIAQRIVGPDKGKFLDWSLPLSDAEITFGVLSGPCSITGSIPVAYGQLRDADGELLMRKWDTAVWAELNGHIYAGGIVDRVAYQDGQLQVEVAGYAAYPHGIPYTDEYVKIQVDPLDTVRGLWRHVQRWPTGDLGVEVDSTRSPVRIGENGELVEFTTRAGEDVSFTANGAYRLNWWESPDIGSTIDSLAEGVPFDYSEEHAWVSSDSEQIRHRIRLAYPRMGRRRHDLRFVLGENLAAEPEVGEPTDEYANEVIVHGAGEGRAMVRATAAVDDGRLRRVAVVTDDSIKTVTAAKRVAREEVKKRSSTRVHLSQISVFHHPNALLGSWAAGDEILVQSDNGIVKIYQWFRVVATTVQPGASEAAVLSLAPVS